MGVRVAAAKPSRPPPGLPPSPVGAAAWGLPALRGGKGAWRAARTESGRGRSQRLFWARPDYLEPRSVQLGCPRPRPGPPIVSLRNEGRRPKLCRAPLWQPDSPSPPPSPAGLGAPPTDTPCARRARERRRRPTSAVSPATLRDKERPAGLEQVLLAWAQPPPGPMRRRQPRGEGGSALERLPRLVVQENHQAPRAARSPHSFMGGRAPEHVRMHLLGQRPPSLP